MSTSFNQKIMDFYNDLLVDLFTIANLAIVNSNFWSLKERNYEEV